MTALPEPDEARARRPLLAGAALVGLVLLGLVAWLALSGPPTPTGVTVAVAPAPEPPKPAAPVRVQPAAPQPAAPSATAETGAQPSTGTLPGFNEGRALLPAPDRDLIEKGKDGFLPIIGRDGRQSWQVYARPFDLADKRPRVALVVSELGPSPTSIDTAINHLPAAVSLAFVPYRRGLGNWIEQARNAGHEVLLDLPMEPTTYPNDDPGPEALLTALDPPANLERLNWVMSQATGYVGFVALMGSRFSTSHDDMLPILTSLQKRGLLYVDNRSSPQTVVPDIATEIGLAASSANRQLDSPADLSRPVIDKKLSELEDIAKHNGSALGITHPYPIVMERIGVWAQSMEDRGVVLAPVSAIIDRSKMQPAAPKPAEAPPAKPTTPAPAGTAPAAPPPAAPPKPTL
jgi:polysaccharide deacetylase 2 family uncharacterized protein YibQ